ncbi:hypothetical protein ACWCP6_16045 [Streptomyces sp. NPDC002004]
MTRRAGARRCPTGRAGPREPGTARTRTPPGAVSYVLPALFLLVLLFLLAVVVRLPWVGDLGMHAATVERLRHRLLDPGDPLVAADVPSPYYSPWTVLLGGLARVTGMGTFVVLRVAALIGLALLVTGVSRFVGTFTGRRAAAALAVLCLFFLWGTQVFAWSGFTGLDSLSLTVSYPSTFALGLSFHLWALLRSALHRAASWAVFLALGLMWSVVLLSHQFTGVVASLGALAMVLGERPRPPRAVFLRLAAGLGLGLVVLALWPYYDFFALLGVGGLELVHRPLYGALPARFGFVMVGVAALALRWGRDRRDPLVLFFVLGAAVYAAGGLTGHYSWGRALPAVLIPAQVAAALEVFERGRTVLRGVFAGVLGAALAVGAWAQSGALGYVVPPSALPRVVADKYRAPWTGYHWITPWVRYGDVVLARTFPARQIPAYGAYTVAPGYPDVFLPDERERAAAVDRYFAPGATVAERRAVLREYGVRWIVQRPGDGGLGPRDPALRQVATGPGGQVLYQVVG